ncbi:hypothetical protein ACHAXA_007594 [Cyclostephanos tholiformis]|uniref:Uncharacterized protein n=1 Tax=Cyclostephanos tholiformis TaxID=382380 RepID=A0ABD3RF84_9STRA
MTSTSGNKQMFEGVGAPIKIEKIEDGNNTIDPTLDSCCQREIESDRKRASVASTLRVHDRVARVEEQRLGGGTGRGGYVSYRRAFNVLPGMDFVTGDGCRCCYDPNGDGGEYELLIRAREEGARGGGGGGRDVGDYDDDDDEEQDGTRIRAYAPDRAAANDDDDGDDGGNDDDDDDEYDYLLDEEDGPTIVEYARRRAELEDVVRRFDVARCHGYGVHRQMSPSRVFDAVGYHRRRGGGRAESTLPPPRGSALHLFDPHSSLSASLDLCLEDVASRYPGTKFIRGNGVASLPHAEGGGGEGGGRSDDGWKRADLPVLLALRDGEVVAWSSGLRDFRGGNDVSAGVDWDEVERWLDRAGALITDVPPLEELCGIRPEEEALLDNIRKLNRTTMGGRAGEDSDDEAREHHRYDCGIDGCNKSFYHEHVGIRTEAQDGLLVSESQVASSSPADPIRSEP